MSSNANIKQCFPLRWDIWFFIFIAAMNFFVYFHSFFHICRSDQIIYLMNTAHDSNWFSLAFRYYSYDRIPFLPDRIDPFLFRPLFFFFLGTARYLFGYHFVLWQMTSFFLHILVLWQLFQLLLKISKDYCAGFLTLFFSMILHNIDMVIWHHIFSYMIFLACLLWCLRLAYDALFCPQQSLSPSIWTISIIMGLSCFIYELGFIFCFLFFLFFILIRGNESSVRKSFMMPFLLLLPILAYLTTYVADLLYRQNAFTFNISLMQGSPQATLYNAALLIFWYTTAGLFPGLLETQLSQRTIFLENYALDALVLKDFSFLLSWEGFFVIGLLLSYLGLIFFSLSLSFLKKRILFFLFIVSFLAAYVFSIAAGRMNTVGPPVIANSSYYSYFYWTFLIILCSSTIHFQKKSRNLFIIKNLFILFLSFITFISATRIRQTSIHIRNQNQLTYQIFNKIEALIKSQSEEKNFSFFVPDDDCLRLDWIPADNSCIFYLLYPHYFKEDNPQYTIATTYEEKLRYSKFLIEDYLERNPTDLHWILILEKINNELEINLKN